ARGYRRFGGLETRYNLACFYSLAMDRLTRDEQRKLARNAIQQLNELIASPRLDRPILQWAPRDPDLINLFRWLDENPDEVQSTPSARFWRALPGTVLDESTAPAVVVDRAEEILAAGEMESA